MPKPISDAELLVSYPILTRETGDGADAAPLRSGAASGLGRQARAALRQVLGWRYAVNDTRGFAAALRATSVRRQVDGQESWEWRSPTFMVQADLGEVTGAQASLVARVTQNAAECNRLVDTISGLRAAIQDDDVATVKALIRSSLEELVAEVGQLGGPRVARVDGLLWSLMGGLSESIKPSDREHPYFHSLLGQLQIRLGLDGAAVNTLDDEKIYSEFIALRDLFLVIDQSWRTFRTTWKDGASSMGALLVHLSRYLDVIVESVHEVEACMDSVFFGAAERQAFRLTLAPHAPLGRKPTKAESDAKPKSPETLEFEAINRFWRWSDDLADFEPVTMTVGELLRWIEGFAGEEARRLVQEGGRDGFVHACFTLARLYLLTEAAFRQSYVDAEQLGTMGLSGTDPATRLRATDHEDEDEIEDEDGEHEGEVQIVEEAIADRVPPTRRPASAAAGQTRPTASDDEADGCTGCHGFYHRRVSRALCELACYLLRAAKLDPGRTILYGVEMEVPYGLSYMNQPTDGQGPAATDPRVVAAVLTPAASKIEARPASNAYINPGVKALVSKPHMVQPIATLPIADTLTGLPAFGAAAVPRSRPEPDPELAKRLESLRQRMSILGGGRKQDENEKRKALLSEMDDLIAKFTGKT